MTGRNFRWVVLVRYNYYKVEMANCPHCQAKVSFLNGFKPGGKFNCAQCHKIIYKKIFNEFLFVLPPIAVSIIGAYFLILILCFLFPAFEHHKNFLAVVYMALSLFFCVVTDKFIWDRFIKL